MKQQRDPRDGGDLIAWFGYGSLVNRQTIPWSYVSACPARLNGWRRHWQPRPDMPGFPAALLTVTRDINAGCDGLLVIDHVCNLTALDQREARYHRLSITRNDIELDGSSLPDIPVYLYQARGNLPFHKEPPKILRSYLDVVMQGFLTEHGEDGLRRFMNETGAFDLPVYEDREQPLYPRALELDSETLGLFASIGQAID